MRREGQAMPGLAFDTTLLPGDEVRMIFARDAGRSGEIAG